MAQTRTQMEGTIEALQGRLNPTVLKEQALDSFHDAKTKIKAELREATIGRVEHMVHNAQDTVRETGRSFADNMKSNPIPTTLIGVGLAWLFINARRERPWTGQDRRRLGVSARRRELDTYDYEDRRFRGYQGDDYLPGESVPERREAAEAVRERYEEGEARAEEIADRAKEAASTAKERMGQLKEDVSASFEDATQRARTRARELANRAQARAQRLETRAEEAFKDNPIAFGAALLAVGTAIGLALPRTRREDRLLGEKRDQVLAKAEDVAHEAIDRVGEAASELHEEVSPGSETRH